MRLSDFKVLSFDTYGTLIDWETGMMDAFKPLLARLDKAPSREAVLEQFAREETRQQSETPGMIYSELLATVYMALAKAWGATVSPAEAKAFGNSVKDWPAFPDSRDALAYLRQHHTIVTLTNCDRVSYAGSAERLGQPWHAIYTAQDIGSYKPSPANFTYLLDRLKHDFGFERGDVLHVAQSLFHDHVPATAFGLATCWIDRRHDAQGAGATSPPAGNYRLDFQFNSMAELVRAHRKELEA
jgi:2-haloalkanoic acid dehalogenase type II